MRSFLLLLLVGLAGCATEPASSSRPPDQLAIAVPRGRDLNAFERCQASLSEVGIEFTPLPDFQTAQGCGLLEGVRLDSTSFGLHKPADVTCEMAVALATFDFEHVQPLARRYFAGKEIVRIVHAGTYDCRTMRGGNGNGRLLSEHSRGKAIDIAGFELADGTRVSVAADWADRGAKGQFLRELSKSACRLFSVVLTPNHNLEHRDHLHLDIGPHRYCGV